MTRAFNRAGCPIFSPRQSLLLSPASLGWREALAFGKRQYRILWFEARILWILAAVITVFPMAAAIVALSLTCRGNLYALAAIGVSLFLGEVRYRSRRKIVAALWGGEAIIKNEHYWRVERWLRPLWWSFHALCIFSALGSRHIRWAGVDYFVRGPQDTEVSR